jgi:hypothetical protein
MNQKNKKTMETKDYKAPTRRMTTAEFQRKVELAIISERHSDEPEQIQTVWLGYVLGNIKGLFIAVGKDGVDGCYYEATYRSETDDVWIDVYEKKAQIKL